MASTMNNPVAQSDAFLDRWEALKRRKIQKMQAERREHMKKKYQKISFIRALISWLF